MQTISEISALRNMVIEARKNGKSIGFVPTMGFLHKGHRSLMIRARQENDLVIASVFVNPTQFGPNEDFESYPRNPEADSALMEEAGVDVAFFPSVDTLYPEGYETYVNLEGELTHGLCGASRPGHFKGVTTIVAKLFNLVQPDRAYFGQKDAQQVAVIRRMVRDLNMPVEVVACPIVRESDGLALSSRNTYLNSHERQDALVLSKALKAAEVAVVGGERSAAAVVSNIRQMIAAVPFTAADYVEIVDANSLKPLETLQGNVLIALAVKIGRTRLIDNCILEVPHAG